MRISADNAAVDKCVLDVDPALGPLGITHCDAVLVTGSWLAGATTLAVELAERLPNVSTIESDGLSVGQAPSMVIFVCSGIAPLTSSDCGLIDMATANTDAVILVLSKIDIQQSWREVIERNRTILAGHNPRFADSPWVGVSVRGEGQGLDKLVEVVSKTCDSDRWANRNRLRAWKSRLLGMLEVAPVDDGGSAEALRNQRLAAVRRTRVGKSERLLVLRNRIAQARMALQYFARQRVRSVSAELREDIAELRRRDISGFGELARRRMQAVVAEVEEGSDEHLAEVAAEVTGRGAVPRAELARVAAHEPHDPPVRSRRLETRMMALFGIFFGLGAALTVYRLVAYLLPGWAPLGLAAGLVAGGCISAWLVAVRGLLHDRAVLDRWVGDNMGELGTYLEQSVSARVLEVETRLSADLVDIDDRASDKLATQIGQIDSQLRDQAMNTARAAALRNRDLPAVRRALAVVTERLDDLRIGREDRTP